MSKLKFETALIAISALTFSRKFQAREEITPEVMEDYTRIAKSSNAAGADSPFPDLRAVKRKGETIVFSGFTRGKALKAADYTKTKVDVAEVPDDFPDSEIFNLSVQANLEHGARPTTEDKIHNMLRILSFPENKELNNVQLGEMIGASEYFVRSHRPAALTTETRSAVSKKTGKKRTIKTGLIGKKKGKAPKPAKKDKKGKGKVDKESDALDKALDGAMDDDTVKAVNRIAKLLDGNLGFTEKGIQDAVKNGAIKLSNKDLKAWAANTDSKLLKSAPLVINRNWRPAKAFSHLDKEVTSKTNVDHLINSAISGGGVVRNPNNSAIIGEKVVDNDNFLTAAWDKRVGKMIWEPL